MTLEEKLKKLKEHFKIHNPKGITALFVERAANNNKDENDSCIIFNMTNEDTPTTFSFRKLYMCFLDDPTEVDFADNVLNGRYDWIDSMKKLTVFKEYYKSIRTEAEQRRIAKNIKEIATIAKDESSKNRLEALKFLTNNSFNTVESEIKRGRPSKAEKEGAMKLALKEMTEDEQDLARLIQ